MPTQKKKTNGNIFVSGWDANSSFDKLADAGRENMEEFVAASSIAAQGFGSINQAWPAFAKTAFERNGAAAEAIFSAKNASDAAEIQADWVRSSFDNYISESCKITEMAVKTANEAVAPIRSLVDGVVETLAENAS